MRRASTFVLGVAALLTALCSSAAVGSTGGPELAELLGWDARDSKAFFRIAYVDESGLPPGVFYIALAGPSAGRLVRVAWSLRARKDSIYCAKLAFLRRRLVPLREELAPTIPVQNRVVEADTLHSHGGPWLRFRVLLSDLQCLGGGTLDVTTIGDPSVRVIRQWTIPGRRERLGVVSFRGVPTEYGYEVQVPVLLPGERDTLRVTTPGHP